MVKANGYGHGAIEVSRTLLAAGAERLAVATLDEGLALRAAGISAPILVLWLLGQPEAARAIEAGLEPIAFDEPGVALLEEAAAAAGKRASVQLKIDTGLGRQGVDPSLAVDLAIRIQRSRHLRLAGTFQPPGGGGRGRRLQRGPAAAPGAVAGCDALGRRRPGAGPRVGHRRHPGVLGAFADAVRPGLGLYGLLPSWAADRDPTPRPVLSLKALALRIFDLPAGTPVGYGLRFRAARATRIATLGIGYGDGWPRAHANNGRVLVRGRVAPIVGAVSMDGLTVDLGQVDDVTYADEFVLIGEQMGARITADEVATERRTINYEVTTALRDRLPRLHRGVD